MMFRHKAAEAETEPRVLIEELGKPYVLDILDATTEIPRSVTEICLLRDLPRTTVYRRIDDLVDLGLVVVQLQPSKSGHHTKIYENNLEQLTVHPREGEELAIELEVRDSPADRFATAARRLRDA